MSPAHPFHLIIPYLMIMMILCSEGYKFLSFLLHVFVHPASTSSSYDPNTLLSTLISHVAVLFPVRHQARHQYRMVGRLLFCTL